MTRRKQRRLRVKHNAWRRASRIGAQNYSSGVAGISCMQSVIASVRGLAAQHFPNLPEPIVSFESAMKLDRHLVPALEYEITRSIVGP